MKKIAFILLALITCFQSYSQPAFVKDSLDNYIKREMERWQIPGLAVAIVKDGKIITTKGYGVTDLDSKQAVNEFSLFQIASNTKAFTGTAIALLDYEKRISLDEKVTTYFADFKLYDEHSTHLCTVRDLLCHRIGLETFQGDFLNWGSTITRKDIIYKLRDNKPVYPFRYKYGYCNAGFVAAGELIPHLTDTSWDNFLRFRFFEPLKMKHTNTFYSEIASDKNACKPYTLVDNKLVKMPYTNIDNIGGAAAINSCVHDMANWLLMQLDSGRFDGKQIFPWKVLAETRKSNTIVSDATSRYFKSKHFTTYGLGWESYDYAGRRIFEHGGGANGFVTKTKFIPEENLGILVYTNTDVNSLYEALATQIIESYFNLPYRNISEFYFQRNKAGVEEEQKTIKEWHAVVAKKNKPSLDLKQYEGIYQNTVYGEIEIKAENGKLNIYFAHHPQNIGKLEFMENNTFMCTYTDVTCGIQKIPFSVENEKVKSVTVKVNDFIDYLSYEFVKMR